MVERHAETATGSVRRRHFEAHVIVLCVRWYLRYCLTLRDLEELMMERSLAVDHSTIGAAVRAGTAQAPSPEDPNAQPVLAGR